MSDLLNQKLSELEQLGINSSVCVKVDEHIEHSIPEKIQRISPYRLADE